MRGAFIQTLDPITKIFELKQIIVKTVQVNDILIRIFFLYIPISDPMFLKEFWLKRHPYSQRNVPLCRCC